jgi:hypothetical protein
MMKLLRKHRTWLMTVIAVLSIPFIFYFVKTDPSRLGNSEQFARVYDRNVSLVEARRAARLCGLAQQLGMFSFVQDLTAGAQNQDNFYAQFTLNLIILRHEAARLGIRPSSAEVVDLVRSLNAFRGPNGFDSKKYDEFTQSFLSPNGFTEAQIEELARDEISLNKIKTVVAAGISVSETESKTNFEQLYGKMTVSVARFRLEDFAKNLKISDDDIKKYYEAHKAELKTEEKRKVEFVNLALTDEQKKLQGKERIDILQKLADRATDFTQALLEKGESFKQVAAKFQLPVRETGEFTVSAPDPQLKTDAQLPAVAFQLTQQEPNSDAVQAGDGFYLLHLSGVVEPRPLSVEEAKPKIVEAIKTQRSREMLSNRAAQAAHDLRESLKSGAPLVFSLEKAGLKAEKLSPFSIAEEIDAKPEASKPEKQSPDLPVIKRAAADLNVGDASEFFPTDEGGAIVILEKREPPDEAKYREGKAVFDERFASSKRRIAFYEWMREREREAGLLFQNREPSAPPQKSS